MSVDYLRNFFGADLSDEEMQKVPYPKAELTTHVTIKFMQFGGIVGTWLVGPLMAVASKETRNMFCLKQKMTKAGRAGVFIGVPLGFLATYGKIRSENDAYKVWDRCYRLRYNRDQVRVDRACAVGSIGGAVVGAATTGEVWFLTLMGMSAGILLMAIYNNKILKKDQKPTNSD